MMNKILMLLLILTVSLFGQTSWEQGEDVSNSNGNYFLASNEDSVYWEDDTLYICGAETAYIFINSGYTNGMLTYKGDVYAKAITGHAADSARVVFQIAKLKGMAYNALDANVTETYYNMDSVEVAATAIGTFYFYPFQNTNLQGYNHSSYYILRMRGRYSTNAAAVIIKEERVRAF